MQRLVDEEQESVSRHSESLLHGVEAPAARQVVPSQYVPRAHCELDRQASPTTGVPHVPVAPTPPSAFTTLPRQRSVGV
ncbi:MAG: hypothetical protein INH41_06095 [Myxococcaceae bacterium]|nr:hypothetical protein [Myxococcaceae bacterium]MCA3011958.1 hypothetical protein [Myxococcaceae bacterium]